MPKHEKKTQAKVKNKVSKSENRKQNDNSHVRSLPNLPTRVQVNSVYNLIEAKSDAEKIERMIIFYLPTLWGLNYCFNLDQHLNYDTENGWSIDNIIAISPLLPIMFAIDQVWERFYPNYSLMLSHKKFKIENVEEKLMDKDETEKLIFELNHEKVNIYPFIILLLGALSLSKIDGDDDNSNKLNLEGFLNPGLAALTTFATYITNAFWNTIRNNNALQHTLNNTNKIRKHLNIITKDHHVNYSLLNWEVLADHSGFDLKVNDESVTIGLGEHIHRRQYCRLLKKILSSHLAKAHIYTDETGLLIAINNLSESTAKQIRTEFEQRLHRLVHSNKVSENLNCLLKLFNNSSADQIKWFHEKSLDGKHRLSSALLTDYSAADKQQLVQILEKLVGKENIDTTDSDRFEIKDCPCPIEPTVFKEWQEFNRNLQLPLPKRADCEPIAGPSSSGSMPITSPSEQATPPIVNTKTWYRSFLSVFPFARPSPDKSAKDKRDAESKKDAERKRDADSKREAESSKASSASTSTTKITNIIPLPDAKEFTAFSDVKAYDPNVSIATLFKENGPVTLPFFRHAKANGFISINTGLFQQGENGTYLKSILHEYYERQDNHRIIPLKKDDDFRKALGATHKIRLLDKTRALLIPKKPILGAESKEAIYEVVTVDWHSKKNPKH